MTGVSRTAHQYAWKNSDVAIRDVDEAVQALITMIEPMLTAILGVMILWIAVAVFGPIYSSFENLDI